MNKKNQVNSTVDIEEKKNFWNFPEKINNFMLLLIILIALIIFSVLMTLVLKPRSYEYYPHEKEIVYAEDMDVYVKYYSNYTYSSDKLNKKDYLTICYVPIDKTIAQPQVIKTSIIGKTKDNQIEYLSPQSEIPDYFGNIMQRTLYPNHDTSGDGYKNIHVRLGYNLKTFTGSSPEVTNGKVLTFNEEILTLSKNEIKKENCNDFIERTDIFSEFYVNLKDQVDTYTTKNVRKLSTKITVLSSLTKKYHLDYEVFLIKDGEVYEVCGYYGISNVNTPSTEMISTLPDDYTFDFVIAKAKFTDAEGKTITLLYKQPFNVE